MGGFFIATAMEKWNLHKGIALAITTRVEHNLRDTPEAGELPSFEKALLFGVGYAGTAGGLAILTSTPPNIILAGLARELFGIDVTYFGWMVVGMPVSLVLVLGAWFYLGRVAFPMRLKQLPGGSALIERERTELGP